MGPGDELENNWLAYMDMGIIIWVWIWIPTPRKMFQTISKFSDSGWKS